MQVKSENIKKVIDLLKSVLPQAKRDRSFNMMQGNTVCNNLCETVHCVGGWFAIALRMHYGVESLDYTKGADKMAEILEFTNSNISYPSYFSHPMTKMSIYFTNNEEIWGNDFANAMFADKLAYYHPVKRPRGARNLQHVIDHWEEVYLRVYALENPTEVTNPPIYIEDIIEEDEINVPILVENYNHF